MGHIKLPVMVSGGETLFMADDELNRACGVGEA